MREKRAEEGIEERRKKINLYDQRVNNYAISSMVSLFSEQAKLDEIFRNNKLWLKTYKNEKKWQRLQSLLEI